MIHFITKADKLEGKEIAFCHIEQFSDRLLIVTKDGGIFGASSFVSEFEGESESKIYKPLQMENYVFENRFFIEELVKRGIITIEEIRAYEKKKEEDKLEKIR